VLAIVVLAAVAVVAAGTAGAVVAVGGHASRPGPAAPRATAPRATARRATARRATARRATARRATARPGSAAAVSAVAHPLRLVAGSGLMNGIYTRYPHSTAGAVSAAAEFITELGCTIDPDRAAAIARLIADPSYRGAAQDAVRGAIGTRRQLRLPAAGSLPGTAVLLVPVMYQLRDVTAGRLTVLLLFDYTEILPSVIRERLGVTAARMNWTPAGWRLLQPADSDLSALLATPGTASAVRKGWKVMTDAV
jgi:hypothetical protein